MTREIPLTQGAVTLVDDEDFERFAPLGWYAAVSGALAYAVRHERAANAASRRLIRLHRLIIGAPDGTVVDHVDGNGLNNRRCNLRLATAGQNASNSIHRGNKHGFRGLVMRNRPTPYVAKINVGCRRITIGCFKTAEDAARAYDDAARRMHGEFARLNFPHEGEQHAYERGT